MLRLLVGACTCSFAIASVLLIPEMLASSYAQWLFSLASVSSDRLDDVAAIDKGEGSISL
jgi:hypothetical protein